MDSILRAFDRSEEVTTLKEQLIEKDREIDKLKKLIVKVIERLSKGIKSICLDE